MPDKTERESRLGLGPLLDGAASLAVVLGSAASALIAVGVTANIVIRTLTGSGISGVNETSVLLMVTAAFLGFIEAERSGAHVRTTIVTARTPPRVRKVLRSSAMVLLAGICAVMAFAAVERALTSYRTGEFLFGVVRYPIWPTRAAIALGLALLGLYALHKAVRIARGSPTDLVAPGAGDAPHAE